MDGMLWQLVWINLITPNFPFIFPLRMAITAGTVETSPWWLVLLIANLSGGIGMLPVYAIARWKAADKWHQRLERYDQLRHLRHRWRSNMFVVQILMNVTPLPDMVSSGLAGCERYPIWRLLLSQLIGRSFHNLPLVLGGLLLAKFPWFVRAIGMLQSPLVWLALGGIGLLWWLFTRQRQNSTQIIE